MRLTKNTIFSTKSTPRRPTKGNRIKLAGFCWNVVHHEEAVASAESAVSSSSTFLFLLPPFRARETLVFVLVAEERRRDGHTTAIVVRVFGGVVIILAGDPEQKPSTSSRDNNIATIKTRIIPTLVRGRRWRGTEFICSLVRRLKSNSIFLFIMVVCLSRNFDLFLTDSLDFNVLGVENFHLDFSNGRQNVKHTFWTCNGDDGPHSSSLKKSVFHFVPGNDTRTNFMYRYRTCNTVINRYVNYLT